LLLQQTFCCCCRMEPLPVFLLPAARLELVYSNFAQLDTFTQRLRRGHNHSPAYVSTRRQKPRMLTYAAYADVCCNFATLLKVCAEATTTPSEKNARHETLSPPHPPPPPPIR
jgi:hypothetical protein